MKRAGWRRTHWLLAALVPVLALVAAALFGKAPCPSAGLAVTAETRAFVRLKNRTAIPAATDFDARVTLDALLAGGDDRGRWSESRAAAVEGFIVGVGPGGIEAANCYSPVNRDTHVYIALRPDASPRERLVAEVTPRLREWARGRGLDWSEAALERELVGRRARVEGWLLFDTEHEAESENTAPGRDGNWRATAWELHPVTSITVSRTMDDGR